MVGFFRLVFRAHTNTINWTLLIHTHTRTAQYIAAAYRTHKNTSNRSTNFYSCTPPQPLGGGVGVAGYLPMYARPRSSHENIARPNHCGGFVVIVQRRVVLRQKKLVAHPSTPTPLTRSAPASRPTSQHTHSHAIFLIKSRHVCDRGN